MSEPAPEFPGLTAYLEKLLQQQAEAKLVLDGLSQVVAAAETLIRQIDDRAAGIEADVAIIMQVIEEARPLLESGPAKFLASRRQMRKLPSGPAA